MLAAGLDASLLTNSLGRLAAIPRSHDVVRNKSPPPQFFTQGSVLLMAIGGMCCIIGDVCSTAGNRGYVCYRGYVL